MDAAVAMNRVRRLLGRAVSSRARRFIAREQRRWSCWPPLGMARFVPLWRLTPHSRRFGLDRGRPIDRYYIERFLTAHAVDIRGRLLEIGDDMYTRQLGGDRVHRSDVLHARSGRPGATIVADLQRAEGIAADTFDCIILTQTLQFVYDVRAAVGELWRILRPHGVVLATLPGITQISRYDMERWGEYWRFTTLSARRLFEDVFGPSITVEAHGNVLAAIAFVHGCAVEDMRDRELDYVDPDYELIITVRAVKGGPSGP